MPPPLSWESPKVSAERLPNSRQDSRTHSYLIEIPKSTIDLKLKEYFKYTSQILLKLPSSIRIQKPKYNKVYTSNVSNIIQKLY